MKSKPKKLQFTDNNGVIWSDMGTCPHGQTYDPMKQVCRDIFCLDGYVFGPNGCEKDPDRYVESNSTSTAIYPKKLLVELTLNHKMCLYVQGHNESARCLHPFLLDLATGSGGDDTEWPRRLGNEFVKVIVKKTNISVDRIQEFEVISRETSRKVVTSAIEDFYDNNDDYTLNK